MGTDSKASKGSTYLKGAAKAAMYNMVLQLSIRIMTFILNAIMLRHISKELLGVVNVRLVLLYSTTLFVSSEAFDQACLSRIDRKNWKQVVNLMWCCAPMGICVGLIASCVWIFVLEQPNPEKVPYYAFGVFSFAITSIIEMCARPHYIIGQVCLFGKIRVLIVGFAELSKCIIAVSLVLNFPHLGLLNFSIAQICSGILYTVSYYATFYVLIKTNQLPEDFVFNTPWDLFPAKPKDLPYFDDRLTGLTVSFFKQSLIKQMLTEGEKYVMTIFNVLSFGEQGVYDVINNLGSMAPRFIFLPIEESGRLFFSQSLSRGRACKDQSAESLELATSVLQNLLKSVVLTGLIIMTFGFSYSYLALDLYGGSILSSGSGPLLLRWYCFYILVIAVNGTTECFYFALMNLEEINNYNKKMILFSLILLISSLVFTKYFGAVGFVLANCVNMFARIIHSIRFIHSYFDGSSYHPLSGLMPSKLVMLSLLVAFAVTSFSESMFCCHRGIPYNIVHMCVGAIMGLGVLAVVYLTEKDLIHFVRTRLLSKDTQHQEKKTN